MNSDLLKYKLSVIIPIIPHFIRVICIVRHSIYLIITELLERYWFLPDKEYFWCYSKKLIQNKLYLNRANPLPWPNKCCRFVSGINQCLCHVNMKKKSKPQQHVVDSSTIFWWMKLVYKDRNVFYIWPVKSKEMVIEFIHCGYVLEMPLGHWHRTVTVSTEYDPRSTGRLQAAKLSTELPNTEMYHLCCRNYLTDWTPTQDISEKDS